MSLKLTKEFRDGIDEIAAALGISSGEVIRNAIALRLRLWEFLPPSEVAIKIVIDPFPRRPMTDGAALALVHDGPPWMPDPALTMLLNNIRRRP